MQSPSAALPFRLLSPGKSGIFSNVKKTEQPLCRSARKRMSPAICRTKSAGCSLSSAGLAHTACPHHGTTIFFLAGNRRNLCARPDSFLRKVLPGLAHNGKAVSAHQEKVRLLPHSQMSGRSQNECGTGSHGENAAVITVQSVGRDFPLPAKHSERAVGQSDLQRTDIGIEKQIKTTGTFSVAVLIQAICHGGIAVHRKEIMGGKTKSKGTKSKGWRKNVLWDSELQG